MKGSMVAAIVIFFGLLGLAYVISLVIDIFRMLFIKNSYKSYSGTIVSKKIRQLCLDLDYEFCFVYQIKDEYGEIHQAIDWCSGAEKMEAILRRRELSYSYDELECGKLYKFTVFKSCFRGEVLCSFKKS